MAQLPKKNSGGGTGNRPPQGDGDSGSRPVQGGSSKSTGASGSPSGRPANRTGSPSGGSGKASRPVSSQVGGSRPPVTRQPVGRSGRPAQSQQAGFRQGIDRTLPPFSTRRYLAIWVPIMAVVVLVLLLLLFTQNNSPKTAGQTAPTAAAGSAYGGATAAPQPASGQNTSAPAPTAPAASGAVTSTQSLSGPGKYMTITTAKGTIVCKLYTDPAAGVSKTIANFETKAKAGYFNGLTFHRVEDWVIQGGDPLGTGSGGGQMPSEYNQIDFGVGALGIARASDPAINNDSQFFITKKASSFLDGQYTNWGQVVKGMDVVNNIAIGDKITSLTIQDLQQAP